MIIRKTSCCGIRIIHSFGTNKTAKTAMKALARKMLYEGYNGAFVMFVDACNLVKFIAKNRLGNTKETALLHGGKMVYIYEVNHTSLRRWYHNL